jgi:hypothetical protein
VLPPEQGTSTTAVFREYEHREISGSGEVECDANDIDYTLNSCGEKLPLRLVNKGQTGIHYIKAIELTNSKG